MLNEEKRYYANLLATNRGNMIKTWVILKGIVNKNKSNQSQSKFKFSDGTITNDKYMICEKFNEFFVSVGPNLAKKIPEARYFTFVLPRGKKCAYNVSWASFLKGSDQYIPKLKKTQPLAMMS